MITLRSSVPAEILLRHCERDAQMLLYELEYRATLRLGAQCAADRYLEPLAALAAAGTDTSAQPWWQSPAALPLIRECLDRERFVVLDNFLPDADTGPGERSRLH